MEALLPQLSDTGAPAAVPEWRRSVRSSQTQVRFGWLVAPLMCGRSPRLRANMCDCTHTQTHTQGRCTGPLASCVHTLRCCLAGSRTIA
eukprot:365463-Chlamydomonas_euryale.AAC.9